MDLNLICPINKLGYGTASRHILRELHAQGNKVALFPIARPTMNDVDFQDIVAVEAGMTNARLYNSEAPSLRIWHQNDLAMKIGRGPSFAYPFFELETFDETEKHHLSSQDALIVSSQWAKQVVQDNGIKTPTFVAPLGVDTEIFNPSIVKQRVAGPTVFFNCGKWEIRKGHDILIAAFNLAFKPEDNIELRMMPTNPFLRPEQVGRWEDIYLGSELGAAGKVKLLPRVDKHEEVAIMMGEADCGVFPARAEGWNLELLEMMAVGKYVATTNYSAHTEFCNGSNSMLLNVDELEPALDGVWFFGQGKWAALNEEHIVFLAEWMKSIHAKVQVSNNYLVNEEGAKTAQKLTWTNTAKLITQHLGSL